MLKVNNLIGFGGGDNLPPSEFSFLGSSTSSANASSYTISGASLGAADPLRKLVIVALNTSGGDTTPDSVTVDTGTVYNATEVITVDAGLNVVSFWIVSVPESTTGDIAVNYSGNQSSHSIAVYRLVAYSSTPYATQSDTTTDPSTVTIDCPAEGCIIAGSSYNALGSTTWTGLTERHDAIGDTMGFSSAGDKFSTAQSGLVITADCTGSGADACLVAVAFARGN